MSHERLIAINRLSHIVIVETPDAIFVSDMETSRDVKEIVAVLKAQKRLQAQKHTTVTTPWGSRTTLEAKPGYQVHRLNVFPKESAVIRNEGSCTKTLVLVDGTARILQNDREIRLTPGSRVAMTPMETIRIENPSSDEIRLLEIETTAPDIQEESA
jgi:mannose-6-phosphate isomerase-like protein (cupin superfamily)